MALCKEGNGVLAQFNWHSVQQFDYGPSPIENKSLKLANMILVFVMGLLEAYGCL